MGTIGAVRKLSLLLMLFLSGCGVLKQTTPEPESVEEYVPASFAMMQGWSEQEAAALAPVLLASCQKFARKSGAMEPALFGTYEQWTALCGQLSQVSDGGYRQFFETHFSVYQLSPQEPGLFTGYYLPVIPASREKTDAFPTPLLGVPDDLVQLSLQNFNPDLKGRLYGKVRNGWLVPYEDREGINRREQQGDYDDTVVAWLEDPVERIFLHIQGSGILRFEDGEYMHVRIAARNGHKYFAIGRYMKQQGMLEQVSMQSIKQWLKDHPERQDEVLFTNPDFIFFRQIDRGPLGAQGVVLTPGRSAAVDNDRIPLGVPLWLDTEVTTTGQPFRHAMVAQDVGSAIKGPVRADIYFGMGEHGASLAGYQNAGGKLFVMVPAGAK
ncbi:murein transglycosylase A [Endozoicomonadaceae bacterium StTr2]